MANFGESLSRREKDVLEELIKGASNKEIAANLSISPNTVKVHLRNLFTKLGASSRTEAVMLSIQHNVIDTGFIVAPTEDESRLKPTPPLQEIEVKKAEPIPVPVTETIIEQSTATAETIQPTQNEKSRSPLLYLIPALLLPVLFIGVWILQNLIHQPLMGNQDGQQNGRCKQHCSDQ